MSRNWAVVSIRYIILFFAKFMTPNCCENAHNADIYSLTHIRTYTHARTHIYTMTRMHTIMSRHAYKLYIITEY